jgi:hypothetical protein
MENTIVPVFIAVMIIIAIIVRLWAGSLDGDRIDRYIGSKGGVLIDKRWTPFGKGWFGSEHQRLYEIRYFDADANEHKATCKTNMLAGVYFTEDIITSNPESCSAPDPQAAQDVQDENPDAFVDSLIDENQKLREEIERLRGDA